MFEGIDVLLIQTKQFQKRMVTNVQEIHLQIVGLLVDLISKFYTFDQTTCSECR